MAAYLRAGRIVAPKGRSCHCDDERKPGGAIGATVRAEAPATSTHAAVCSSPRVGRSPRSRLAEVSGRARGGGRRGNPPSTSYSRSVLPSPKRTLSFAFSESSLGTGQENERTVA